MRKLQRAIINEAWDDIFGALSTVFNPIGISDHAAITVKI